MRRGNKPDFVYGDDKLVGTLAGTAWRISRPGPATRAPSSATVDSGGPMSGIQVGLADAYDTAQAARGDHRRAYRGE